MTVIAHIEDSKFDHALLCNILGGAYQIICFENLTMFLESDFAFDLIIADLRLPESYGYETVERIREKDSQTPLLALTGMGGPYMTGDIIKNLLDRGADNVVSKEILCDSRMICLVEELLVQD